MTETMTTCCSPSLLELRGLLDGLAAWEDAYWRDTASRLSAAAPLLLGALRHSCMWDRLSEAEQACVYWSMAEGQNMANLPVRLMKPGREEARIARLRVDLATLAARLGGRDAWPEGDGDRVQGYRRAERNLALFHELSADRRVAGFRLMADRHARRLRMTELAEHRGPAAIPAAADRGARSPCPEDPLYACLQTARSVDVRGLFAPYTYRLGEGCGMCRKAGEDLVRLPRGWQIEVMRRIETGADPLRAGFTAGSAINQLYHYFRIGLAWNATA
jgi:hypothetical protein